MENLEWRWNRLGVEGREERGGGGLERKEREREREREGGNQRSF